MTQFERDFTTIYVRRSSARSAMNQYKLSRTHSSVDSLRPLVIRCTAHLDALGDFIQWLVDNYPEECKEYEHEFNEDLEYVIRCKLLLESDSTTLL